jgi:hypothetical protein
LVQDPQGFRILGGDNDTAGIAVNAVTEGRHKAVLTSRSCSEG